MPLNLPHILSVKPVTNRALCRKFTKKQNLLQKIIIKSTSLVQRRDYIRDPSEKLKKGLKSTVLYNGKKSITMFLVNFLAFFIYFLCVYSTQNAEIGVLDVSKIGGGTF